jgi:hypothetical protein
MAKESNGWTNDKNFLNTISYNKKIIKKKLSFFQHYSLNRASI